MLGICIGLAMGSQSNKYHLECPALAPFPPHFERHLLGNPDRRVTALPARVAVAHHEHTGLILEQPPDAVFGQVPQRRQFLWRKNATERGRTLSVT